MSNIEKVVKQAIATFAKPQSAVKYQESLNALAQAVGKITGDDVGIDKELVKLHNNRGFDSCNPLGYVSVFEDANILVSIFVLKSNSTIPLHDHPLMHGVLKVLHGSVHVQSYSLRRNDNIKNRGDDKLCSMNDYYRLCGQLYRDPILARRNPPVTLSAADNCAILTPFESNIHKVTSVSGPSAFLDVLAPPYDTFMAHGMPRECTYFEVLECVDNECTLRPTFLQPNYRTVGLPYRGPKIEI